MRFTIVAFFVVGLLAMFGGGYILYMVDYTFQQLYGGPLPEKPFDLIRQLGWGVIGFGVLILVAGIVYWRRNRGRM